MMGFRVGRWCRWFGVIVLAAAGGVRLNQILEACRRQLIGSLEVYVVNLWYCTLQSAWGRRRRCCIRRASRAISSCRPDTCRDSRLEWALSFDFSPPSTLGYHTGF
jgi:hypothetical protein